MLKKMCIVNGAKFSYNKMDYHLDDLVKKFVKDKKVKVAVAVNNQIIVKSEWKKENF